MKKDLAYIKLISGEYVIGEVAHEDENAIVLKKPLSARFEMMLGGLQMYPYDAFYLNKELEEVIFKKEHIMHIYKGEEIPFELEAKYREFVSGIVQAKTPDLKATPENSDLQKLILGGDK
jgi:hypothetical protein